MSFYQSFKTGILVATAGAAFGIAATGAASAQQCPDWQLNGIPVTTDAETAWAPQSYQMYAGGGVDLAQCQQIQVQGRGFVTAAPNFSISYDARSLGRDLEFRVESTCDTTLLINDATAQWSFNDDADGTLSPRLRLPNAVSGRYDVWVGTYSGQSCQATLIAETFPAGGAMPQQPTAPVCPDWSLGGAEVRLGYGQSDNRPVVAGGQVSLAQNQCNLGINTYGYVAQAPDFSVYYDPQGQTGPLEIAVQSQCDTTLLVNDPSTNWVFNDDSNGLQPALSFPGATAGRYDVWVGTFGSGTCQASISFSTMAPQAPQGQVGK